MASLSSFPLKISAVIKMFDLELNEGLAKYIQKPMSLKRPSTFHFLLFFPFRERFAMRSEAGF
jgi:hypothetical protein